MTSHLSRYQARLKDHSSSIFTAILASIVGVTICLMTRKTNRKHEDETWRKHIGSRIDKRLFESETESESKDESEWSQWSDSFSQWSESFRNSTDADVALTACVFLTILIMSYNLAVVLMSDDGELAFMSSVKMTISVISIFAGVCLLPVKS